MLWDVLLCFLYLYCRKPMAAEAYSGKGCGIATFPFAPPHKGCNGAHSPM